MKLLTISNLFPRPDQPCRGIFNLELFKGFAACAGCEVDNICLVPEWRVWRLAGSFRRSVKEGISTEYVPVFYVPLFGRDVGHVTYGWSMEEVKAKARQSDVVYSTWLYPDSVVAGQVAEECGKPHWLMVQGSDILHLQHAGRRAAILEACRKAAGVICVWSGLGRELAAAGVDERKIHIVGNGVDGAQFKFRKRTEARELLARSEHARPARPDGQELVLFAGNLVEVKGADRMLDVWFKLLDMRDRDIHLAIIGDGPLRKSMMAELKKSASRATVSFLGSMPHDEVACWMNLADCLCLPSRSEGMPNVVLEALVSGLPVVATDVGACGELLGGVPECRLVEDEEVENGLAVAICEVLRLGTDRSAFAAMNRARLPDWKMQAEKILGLIRNGS